MQAGSPDSYIALSWAGASRSTSCIDTEKPEPGRIREMPALQEIDIWRGGGGGRTPSQKRSDIRMPCFAQRCDTGRLLVCTTPKLVSLGMLNPLFGSGIPTPAAFQSNLLSRGTLKQDFDDSCNHSITDVGNKQTNSQWLLGFVYFSKQTFLTGTPPGSKKIHKEISRSKGWSSGSEEVPLAGLLSQRAARDPAPRKSQALFLHLLPGKRGELSKNKMHNWVATV